MEAVSIELKEVESSLSPKELQEQKAKGEQLLAPPAANLLLLGLSPSHYVLKILRGIRSSDLEESLMVLPFKSIVLLFHHFLSWLQEVSGCSIS